MEIERKGYRLQVAEPAKAVNKIVSRSNVRIGRVAVRAQTSIRLQG